MPEKNLPEPSVLKSLISQVGGGISEFIGSASKIVFLLLALTACLGFWAGKLEAQDFMTLATAAFVFYFSHKGEQGKMYAGK
jgi:hypothetical protein